MCGQRCESQLAYLSASSVIVEFSLSNVYCSLVKVILFETSRLGGGTAPLHM